MPASPPGRSAVPPTSEDLVIVDPPEFDKLVERCERHTAEELSKRHGLPFAEAETLNPALLVYQNLLRLTQAPQMIVSHVSMRDGLLLELARAVTGQEDRALLEGVIHSAIAVAQKYRVDMKHARTVADLAVRLFDELHAEHGLGPRQRLLLEVAGLLHEVGGFVSSRSHHKHSGYLIANSEIFGLNRDEIAVVAQVARYHRRSGPKPSHAEYVALPRETPRDGEQAGGAVARGRRPGPRPRPPRPRPPLRPPGRRPGGLHPRRRRRALGRAGDRRQGRPVRGHLRHESPPGNGVRARGRNAASRVGRAERRPTGTDRIVRGTSLRVPPYEAGNGVIAMQPNRSQFSLRTLLAAVTAAAVVFALARFIGGPDAVLGSLLAILLAVGGAVLYLLGARAFGASFAAAALVALFAFLMSCAFHNEGVIYFALLPWAVAWLYAVVSGMSARKMLSMAAGLLLGFLIALLPFKYLAWRAMQRAIEERMNALDEAFRCATPTWNGYGIRPSHSCQQANHTECRNSQRPLGLPRLRRFRGGDRRPGHCLSARGPRHGGRGRAGGLHPFCAMCAEAMLLRHARRVSLLPRGNSAGQTSSRV